MSLEVLPDRRPADDLLTVDEVARYLRVCERTVRRLHIPYAKVGKLRRYRWKDIKDYLDEKVA